MCSHLSALLSKVLSWRWGGAFLVQVPYTSEWKAQWSLTHGPSQFVLIFYDFVRNIFYLGAGQDYNNAFFGEQN